jgi:hypothetical protein
MTRALLTLAVATLVTGAVASAHHSFSAYYFEDRTVTLEGAVHEFHFRNPHAVLMVTAKDDGGTLRTYAAEFASPSRLAPQGFTKDTLKPGDRVIVTGSPGRVPSEYKVHLKRVQRLSDGWSWGGGRRRR